MGKWTVKRSRALWWLFFRAKNSNAYGEIMWRLYVRPAAGIKDSSHSALYILPPPTALYVFCHSIQILITDKLAWSHGCAHAHTQLLSHCAESELAGEASASLQRQLDDNPAGVTLLKVSQRSHTLSRSVSLSHTHTHPLIKSCNQADFCMY